MTWLETRAKQAVGSRWWPKGYGDRRGAGCLPVASRQHVAGSPLSIPQPYAQSCPSVSLGQESVPTSRSPSALGLTFRNGGRSARKWPSTPRKGGPSGFYGSSAASPADHLMSTGRSSEPLAGRPCRAPG